jgi:nicotinamidase-related amidase
LGAIAFLVAGLAYIAPATRGTSIGEHQQPRKAVLVIDAQEDFMTTQGKQMYSPSAIEGIIEAINCVIEQAHGHGIPVIYIRRETPFRIQSWMPLYDNGKSMNFISWAWMV